MRADQRQQCSNCSVAYLQCYKRNAYAEKKSAHLTATASAMMFNLSIATTIIATTIATTTTINVSVTTTIKNGN